MIRVQGLERRFGAVRAVAGVGFEAGDGRITGLLGPNGAGKSTTLRVLYTVLKPDAGSAVIDGIDVVGDPLGARRRIGALRLALVPEAVDAGGGGHDDRRDRGRQHEAGHGWPRGKPVEHSRRGGRR